MIDPAQEVVSPPAVEKLLAAFGIDQDNREYQQWRRDDGLLLADLSEILSGSRPVLSVDWRACLEAAADDIVHMLLRLGISVDVDLDDEGNEAVFEMGDRQQAVRFGSDDAQDFDDTVRVVNRLIAGTAEFRRFRSSIGSDGWQYALLPRNVWAALDQAVPEVVVKLFERI